MAVKYSNIFHSPKLTQIGIFGFKINHLATVLNRPGLRSSVELQVEESRNVEKSLKMSPFYPRR
jgi:hypothetical protein